MIKLIIFDWDDVITLGAKEAHLAAYHQTLVTLSVHLSQKEEYKRILAKWGKPYREELKELLKEHPELVDQACNIYKRVKQEIFVRSLTIHKETNSILLSLSQQYILAVATGNTREMVVEHITPHFGIPGVFAQILSSHDIDDPKKTKPHPHMLEAIMEKQQVTPDQTIYIGDARTDVLMAKSASVRSVVVLTGQLTRKEAEKLEVPWIIPDITHVPKMLASLD